MTRTAADVQAEIDALEQHETRESKRLEAAVDAAGADEAAWREAMTAWRRQLTSWTSRLEPLKTEHARLMRAELDAATPADLQGLALRLRDAYRHAGTYAVGAGETWEALDTSEAAAWAAVAREAGR